METYTDVGKFLSLLRLSTYFCIHIRYVLDIKLGKIKNGPDVRVFFSWFTIW